MNDAKATVSHVRIEDIIDVDAIDKPFTPGHKSGMSSMDSTGRIERKLYSALGEELDFHEEEETMAGAENQTENFPPVLQGLDLNIPAIKRKRQNTMGSERDRSPIAKVSREETDTVQLDQLSGSPRICGGVSVS